MPSRTTAVMIGAALVSVLMAAASAVFFAPDSETGLLIIFLLRLTAEIVAVVACLRTARHTRGRARLSWGMFAAAIAIWMAADVAYAVAVSGGAQVPQVSWFDAGWLAVYPPMLIALGVIYQRLRPERSWQGLIDGAIVTLAFGVFGWWFLLRPIASQDDSGAVGAFVHLLYPSMDLCCALTLGWCVGRLGHRAPAWLWLVLAGVCVQLTGNIAYSLMAAHGLDARMVSSIGFVGGCWLLAFGARRRRDNPVRAWAPSRRSAPPVWASALPFIAGTSMFLLLVPGNPVVGVVAMVGTVLACWRVIDNLRVHDALLAERNRLLLMDSLTGAFNRRSFERDMDAATARVARGGEPFSLISFDLDRFKQVNDSLGHLVGDQLLIGVVRACESVLRREERLFRLGGDEFAVIASGAPAEAARLAERLREAVRDAAAEIVPDAGVTVSLGVAGCPDDGADTNSLMRQSDAALYAAKRAGRDGVAVAGATAAAAV